MLTHRNIVSDCAAGTLAGLNLSPSDVHLSYLPLAHVYEAVAAINALFIGGSIGFYHGVIESLLLFHFFFTSVFVSKKDINSNVTFDISGSYRIIGRYSKIETHNFGWSSEGKKFSIAHFPSNFVF
jgi:acyl-CoA synthetase (AMP-forming)/AMP-acid ligase II